MEIEVLLVVHVELRGLGYGTVCTVRCSGMVISLVHCRS
jgi:hypothetical protein